MSKTIFLIAIVLFTIFYIKYRFSKDSRFLITIFTVALIIRIISATGIFLSSWYEGNAGLFSGDESVYYKRAVNMAVAESMDSKNIFKDTPDLDNPSFSINLFSILASILIFTFGRSLILIKYFNCFVGALLPVIIFLLAKTIFDNRKVAKMSAILVAFLPSMIVWSSVGLKEPLIMLILASIFYNYIKNVKRFSFLRVGNIIVLAIAFFYLQSNAAIVLAAIYSLWFIFTKLSKFLTKEIAVLVFILVGSFIFLSNQKLVGGKIYQIAEHQTIQYKAGDYRSSRYQLYPNKLFNKYFFDFYHHLVLPKDIRHMDIDSVDYVKKSIIGIKWVNFFISYFKGLVYVLFSPFIWTIDSVSKLMVYPQVVFWWGIMPCIIYGMIWSLRFKRNETILMILFIGSIYSILALTEGNVGSMFRHRDWVTPFCLIFATIGINKFIFGHTISQSGEGDSR